MNKIFVVRNHFYMNISIKFVSVHLIVENCFCSLLCFHWPVRLAHFLTILVVFGSYLQECAVWPVSRFINLYLLLNVRCKLFYLRILYASNILKWCKQKRVEVMRCTSRSAPINLNWQWNQPMRAIISDFKIMWYGYIILLHFWVHFTWEKSFCYLSRNPPLIR